MAAPTRILILLPTFLVLLACEKQPNFYAVSQEYAYQASFALPVGKTSLAIEGVSHMSSNELTLFLSLMKYITFRDTLFFDFEKFSGTTQKMNSVTFRLNTYNQFPNNANIQVYLADINQVLTDSLFTPVNMEFVENAKVNNNGSIEEEAFKRTEVTISGNRLQNLMLVKYVIYSVVVDNSNSNLQLFQYYKDYFLHIQMGVRIDFDFPLTSF